MHIRPFRSGDERALHAVFRSAVQGLARKDYSAQQIDAWLASNRDPDRWSQRIHANQPFVVEHRGEVVAYADVQDSGHIDQFFVGAAHAGRGVGSLLMRHVLHEAMRRGMRLLSSHVSRTAQPLFEKFGFHVVEPRSPVLRGVVIPNVLMHKDMSGCDSEGTTGRT